MTCKCGCGETVTPNRIGRPRFFAFKACADKWHNARRGLRDHHKASTLDITATTGINRAQARARELAGVSC
jgi:hypothetical protein